MSPSQENDEMAYSGLPNGFMNQSSRQGPSFAAAQSPDTDAVPSFAGVGDAQFDIFEWHPAYQSCQRYFVDHAQHDASVQAAAALVNILLPFQWLMNPVVSSSALPPGAGGPVGYSLPWSRNGAGMPPLQASNVTSVSLLPYIRRLVVTGFDKEGVLHGFFGDDWRKGISPLQECERRNYLFSCKSVGWAKVKYQYDMSPQETVPFLKPLQNVHNAEIEAAEKSWSQWLAMEDWMVGPRAPDGIPNEQGTYRREGNR